MRARRGRRRSECSEGVPALAIANRVSASARIGEAELRGQTWPERRAGRLCDETAVPRARVASTPDAFEQRFKADLAKFAKIVKEAHIPAQD
jgi:hypothetical protein